MDAHRAVVPAGRSDEVAEAVDGEKAARPVAFVVGDRPAREAIGIREMVEHARSDAAAPAAGKGASGEAGPGPARREGWCGAIALAELVRRRRDGESIAELAVEAGVAYKTLAGFLSRHGAVGARGGDRSSPGWNTRRQIGGAP